MADPYQWSEAEADELMCGWDAGESYLAIAIRLMKTFRVVYTRNMVAQQCRDRGLKRPRGFISISASHAAWLAISRGLEPRRHLQRRRSEDMHRQRRCRLEARLRREERIQEICRLRENGLSYVKIGKLYNLNPQTIRWHCAINGAWPEGEIPGVGSRRHPASMSQEMEDKAVALREMGLSISQIARELGASANTVKYRLAVRAARDELETLD